MLSSIKTAIFSFLCVAVTAQVAGAVSVLRSRSDDSLIPTLKAVTAISQDMSNGLATVSVATSAAISAGIATDFARIDDRFTKELAPMGATEPYGENAAVPVVNAWKTFVDVHRKMLETLIAKHNIIDAVPAVAAPIATSLRNHEHVFDTFGRSLIALLPTEESKVTQDVDALAVKISNALTAYSD